MTDANTISFDPTKAQVVYLTWRAGAKIRVRWDGAHWLDDAGTIYPFTDPRATNDKIVRCGVGILSTPTHWIINRGCAPHDFAYSSPYYQETHLRSEADQMLEHEVWIIEKDRIGELQAEVIAEIFEILAREGGAQFWENDNTND